VAVGVGTASVRSQLWHFIMPDCGSKSISPPQLEQRNLVNFSESGIVSQLCYISPQIMLSRRILIALSAAAMATCFAAPPDGAALYKSRCAICHDGKPQARMPSHDELAARQPEAIFKAMFEGVMLAQSIGLNEDEGRAIARFLTGKEISAVTPVMSGRCTAAPKALTIAPTDWNGWGQDLGNSRYQPKPGLAAADVPKLKLKWAFGFPGVTMAQGQPAVVGGRVFIGSPNGDVYSLDASTGCLYWTYKAGSAVRNSVSIGKIGSRAIVYFGDAKAFAHAVDAQTGLAVWKTKIEDFQQARVTGSPVFYNGRLYVPIADLEEPSAM
jgi:polyvinyl alcohol dehydrogenase (cytochrome)